MSYNVRHSNNKLGSQSDLCDDGSELSGVVESTAALLIVATPAVNVSLQLATLVCNTAPAGVHPGEGRQQDECGHP